MMDVRYRVVFRPCYYGQMGQSGERNAQIIIQGEKNVQL